MRLLKADRLIFTLFLFSWLFISPSSVNASNQWQISNSIQVYYRLAPNEPCGLYSPISLGDFIKKTLPFEWVDGWANISNGDQALNAGAVAISSWSLSDSNSQVYSVNGQDFFCIDAWPTKINFQPNVVIDQNFINQYPNSIAVVDATSGIIMTHPDAPSILGINAIDAQFRAETGGTTLQGPANQPWLMSIYDPVSVGETPSNNPWGMGQHGSKRWAWGQDDAMIPFPQWNYYQILVQYYTGIHIRDADNNNTRLTPEYRWNLTEWQPLGAGVTVPPPMTNPGQFYGINIRIQNTGVYTWTSSLPSRVAYQWSNLGGTVIGQGNGFDIFTIAPGSSAGPTIFVNVQAPANPGTYKLLIDMQTQVPGGSYENFRDREAGRPWFPYEYICAVGSGGQCYLPEDFSGGLLYLPIILKNAS